MTVHIIKGENPLCGFTSDDPKFWSIEERWVWPEEAHFATCQRCISELHDQDELEVYGCHVTPEHPWPR
jgi:hypothetical protein